MRRILFSLLSIFLLGSLFACSLVRPGSQAPTPTFVNGEITENENPGEAEIYVLVPTATSTSAPNCFDTPVQIRVMENAPRMGIQSLTPEFQWYLGTGGLTMNSLDDWDTMCVPDHYTLYLTSGPDFDDEIVVDVTGYSVVADMTKLTMEWVYTGTLQPVTQYRWFMVGHVGNADLDTWKVTKLHEDAWWYPQSNYFESTFRTGPACTQGGVAVPQLLTLQDGAVIDTLEPWLSWSVDGCMPRFFLFQISTTPDFINPVWERNPDDPGDYTKLRGAWALGGQVDYMLRDCQEYYWRVQGAIGGDPYLPNEPVEYGAFSEVRSFEVNLGGCDSIQHYVPTPIPQPVIRSIVPTAVPVPPQTPCASFTDLDSCNNSGYCHWVVRFASPSSCETGP